jgi:hypothetical protein
VGCARSVDKTPGGDARTQASTFTILVFVESRHGFCAGARQFRLEPTISPRARNDIREVPGQYVVAAMDRLRPCGPDFSVQWLEVDAAIWGRFRIAYKPFKQDRRGLPTSWVWVAAEAQRLDVGQ